MPNDRVGYPIPIALLAGLSVALGIGIVNGLIIAFIEIPALFTTLASGLLFYGIARITVLDGFISYIPNGNDAFLYLGQGRLFGIPIPIIVFIVIAVLVHFMLSRTSVGRFIYAHGDNADTARLSGIPVRPLTVFEYSVSAAIGFLAGLVMAAMNASMNTQVINSTLIFDVILVVVLGGISLVGGRGSVWSVVVGAALIGTLLNGMIIMNLDSNLQSIIKGLVLLGLFCSTIFYTPETKKPHGKVTERRQLGPNGRIKNMEEKSMTKQNVMSQLIKSVSAAVALIIAGGLAADAQQLAGGKSSAELRSLVDSKLVGKTVAWMPTTLGFPLTDMWTHVMQQEAEQMGMTLDVRDPGWNPDTMVQIVNSLIAEKPDVMIVHNFNVQLLAKQLKKAEEAGIHVVQVNMVSNYKTGAYVGADWGQIGRLVGEDVVQACGAGSGSSGKVAVVQGI